MRIEVKINVTLICDTCDFQWEDSVVLLGSAETAGARTQQLVAQGKEALGLKTADDFKLTACPNCFKGFQAHIDGKRQG